MIPRKWPKLVGLRTGRSPILMGGESLHTTVIFSAKFQFRNAKDYRALTLITGAFNGTNITTRVLAFAGIGVEIMTDGPDFVWGMLSDRIGTPKQVNDLEYVHRFHVIEFFSITPY